MREPLVSGLAGWVRLNLTRGIGPAGALNLLRAFGVPEEIFSASHARLSEVVGAALATRLSAPDDETDAEVDTALEWAQQPQNRLLTLSDPDYPQRLLEISDPPALLYVTGNVSALSAPGIGIVGSRHATRGGLENAHSFAHALASHRLAVNSGLARGIDSSAHRGSLDAKGLTVAVMGTGIDRVYPAVNRKLAHAIVQNDGALITEFPIGSAALRSNFPRRNRLIAGLSSGILVIEAARESGSLITARLASECGREVFAIPGSIHSPVSRGCHQLIRQGAKLVESVEDVLAELHPGLIEPAATGLPAKKPSNDPQQQQLLDRIGFDAVSLDALLVDAAIPADAARLAGQLLELELSGQIERLPDGRVRRL
jgi:DNA processing protein